MSLYFMLAPFTMNQSLQPGVDSKSRVLHVNSSPGSDSQCSEPDFFPLLNYAPFLANSACAEWRSRCPTGAGVGRWHGYIPTESHGWPLGHSLSWWSRPCWKRCLSRAVLPQAQRPAALATMANSPVIVRVSPCPSMAATKSPW